MIVNYEFVTGETVSIDVDEKWAKILKELDKEEANNNRKETRRHISLSELGDEGPWLTTDHGEDYLRCAGKTFARDDARFDEAYKTLTPKQKEIYQAVYVHDKMLKEYAEENGISPSAATQQNKGMIKKYEKVFCEP